MKKNTEYTKPERSTVDSYYLSRDIVKMCEVFCSRVLHTNVDEYHRRKQSDLSKIWNDIFYGKLAEWGVYFIYLERGRNNLNPPDMTIYTAKQKSYDADLKYGLFNLHIKSQTYESAERYGDSWMFQCKDPLFELSSEYDIMVGCRVSIHEPSKNFIEGAFVEIKLERQFNKLILSDPKLAKFHGIKKTVYLKENDE